MRNRSIFLALAGIGLLALCLVAFAQAGGQQPTITRSNQFGGGADHAGALPSVAPPDGWKPCPIAATHFSKSSAFFVGNLKSFKIFTYFKSLHTIH